MHKSLKTALCATIFFTFLAFSQEPVTKVSGWQEATPEKKVEVEKALEQKLEGVEKEKKTGTGKAKSVVEKVFADDPSLSPREREIKIRARQIELREELKRLEQAQKKNDTPSERQARRDVEKEERNERKAREAEARAYSNAEISGCEPGSVWVSRRATQRSMFRVMSLIRITNTGTLPVNIESPLYGGELVRNLCSGGSVTLSFVLAWEDPDQLQIPLTAVSRPEDGGLATDQFSSYLSKWDVQYNRVRTQTWQVRMQRQYQAR